LIQDVTYEERCDDMRIFWRDIWRGPVRGYGLSYASNISSIKIRGVNGLPWLYWFEIDYGITTRGSKPAETRSCTLSCNTSVCISAHATCWSNTYSSDSVGNDWGDAWCLDPNNPIVPTIQTILMVTTLADSVDTLVYMWKYEGTKVWTLFGKTRCREINIRLRTVDDTMDQMQVAEGLWVNCATLLLLDRMWSWWDIMRLRRLAGSLSWAEFRVQFKHQFYSSYYRKFKEQEFLFLRQGDISALDYERRFHNLSMFALH
jgi:hypothetical protein